MVCHQPPPYFSHSSLKKFNPKSFLGHEIWNDISQEVKVWGSNPWEEGAWEIGERFAVKWWFLMGDEVLKGTNMWRGMRGQGRLGVESIKARFASGPALLQGVAGASV
jgi:hypothetical protein